MENTEDIITINNVTIINNEQDSVIINKTDNVIDTTTNNKTETTETTDEIIFEKILSIIKDNNSNLLGQYFEELSGIKKEKEREKNKKEIETSQESTTTTEILNEDEIKKKIKRNNRYTYQQEQEDLNKHREDEIIENNKYFNFKQLLNKLIPTTGKTLLYTAVENDCFNDIVLLLLKYGADPNLPVTTATTTSGRNSISSGGSNGETIQNINFEGDSNENYYKKSANTESTIHYVVRNGDSTILNLLLDYNVDVNRLDGFGRTAIILSSANGKTECSRLLVLKSCNVNIVDQRQKTALHLAIDGGYDDIATTITQNGGNVSLRYHYRPKSTKPQNNPSSQDYTDYKDVKILTKLDRYGNIQDGYNQFDSGGGGGTSTGDNGTNNTTSNQPEQIDQSPILTSTVVPRKYSRKSTINSGLTLNINFAKNKKEIEKELTRSIKWNKMIKQWNSSGGSTNEKKRFPTKIKTRSIKGIPDRMRSESWPLLARSEIEKKKNPDLFNQLVQQHSEMEICIDLDVNRAFRNHIFFRERYGVGQVSLFNVLKVYSLYDTNVGYTQGMSSIASLLVMYLSEEDAFWTLQSLMNRPEFDLRTKFLSGLPGFFKMVYVFNNLLNQYFPAVKKALDEIGLDAVLYTTKWFLIGYLDSFPFHISLRVWDLIFSHGYNIVYSVALSLFKLKEKQLLQYKDSFEKLCNLLKSFENFDIDEDIFIKLIIKHKISDKKIEFWEKKFELQQQQTANANTSTTTTTN